MENFKGHHTTPTDSQLKSQDEFMTPAATPSPTRKTDTLSGMSPSDAETSPSAAWTDSDRQIAYADSEDTHEDKAEYFNKILRGEISAVEAYKKVIAKFGGETSQLQTICDEHKKNIEALELFVQRNAATPYEDSGLWGKLVKTIVGAASFIGNATSVQALIEGEEHGLRQYRRALEYNLTMQERGSIEDRIVPCLERHIAALKAMENVH